jgi:hypothetical protein
MHWIVLELGLWNKIHLDLDPNTSGALDKTLNLSGLLIFPEKVEDITLYHADL